MALRVAAEDALVRPNGNPEMVELMLEAACELEAEASELTGLWRTDDGQHPANGPI